MGKKSSNECDRVQSANLLKTQNMDSMNVASLNHLLRPTLGKDVEIVSFRATNFLAENQNFCSTVLGLEIEVDKNGIRESMQLIAKILGTNGFQGEIHKHLNLFETEILFYEQIKPLLEHVAQDFIGGKEMQYPWPAFFGANNTIVLMQDLRVKNYHTVNPMEGMSLAHFRATLDKLAYYHCLGIVAKEKYSEQHRAIMLQTRPPKIMQHVMEASMKQFLKTLDRMPNYRCHRSSLEQLIEEYREYCDELNSAKTVEFKEDDDDPWKTFVHGDCWTNNVLFQENEDGTIQDVKFVDFQFLKYFSCFRDIVYLLGSSPSLDITCEELDEAFGFYRTRLIHFLTLSELDTKKFSVENFDKNLIKIARLQFGQLMMSIMFLAQGDKLEPTDPESFYFKRWQKLIEFFLFKKWL